MCQHELVDELRWIFGSKGVVDRDEDLQTYDADGSMIVAHAPHIVVLPGAPSSRGDIAAQAAEAVRLAQRAGLPVVARGAGTGISGGAIPVRGGILISTARMERVESVSPRDRWAVVQTGVVNAELSAYVEPLGLQFAPDPSSQRAATIGGNIGENAGGPHCLKYGVTTNHVLAVEIVLHNGAILWTGDGVVDAAGYDLTGLIVGSEGTFGVVTRARVKLTHLPEANRVVQALFPMMVDAGETVSAVIAAGYLPTSLEVMDANAIRAVNQAYRLGLPETAGAALIIEVDGVEDGLDEMLVEILDICRANGASELRPARTPEEQARVWAARKSVAGAIGRLAPAYYMVDTVVPRTRLPRMMEEVERLSREYSLDVVNVFHAGDGNLHPLVLYDPRDADQYRRAHDIAANVLKLSIEEGGVISGEHGIGVEKQEYIGLMLSQSDLQAHATLYAIFNPNHRFNPAKMFPPAVDPLDLAEQRRVRIAASVGSSDLGQLEATLKEIVGAEALCSGGAAMDYTIQGHIPRYVVLPANVEQLAAVMAACHHAGAVVIPWGGGTKQNRGYLRSVPDVVVATRRLTGVTRYEPEDLTIGIGAGATLAELQAILAEHGQMLPLDAPQPEQATIGGLVATAADGPRRLGYGTLRDLVLGMIVVEVDGTILHVGAQVVKNVTGYDLTKLFLGSYGTLGVIAGVSLRTLPRSRGGSTLVLDFEQHDAALALLDDLAASTLNPTAVECLAESATLPMITLAIRVEGSPAACDRHMRELRYLAVCHSAADVRELHGEEQTAFWAQVADVVAGELAHANAALLRVAVPPSELGAVLDDLLACAAVERLSARALNGVVYAHVHGADTNLHKLQMHLVERWRHAHVLACDPDIAADLPIWGATPAGIDLMRAIKQSFDPLDKLNPGRYIV